MEIKICQSGCTMDLYSQQACKPGAMLTLQVGGGVLPDECCCFGYAGAIGCHEKNMLRVHRVHFQHLCVCVCVWLKAEWFPIRNNTAHRAHSGAPPPPLRQPSSHSQ